ncbi:hypothetical protein AMAG_03389 [Allomyces macrogynus ATCC 38327]|uniref:Uncharacterized protein n=1 Tax=Allomyces macrogynus (strain ATCC 38327) TaxID=578462 RepID=A0A0L0S9H0_ALLM3|nr:hypothetical protein AMAG_03389 [Allomyces macrogynus ATCC 38327]|eukprot:KNE59039.1 hypothetical protein AMAG_03389 [Allomyces macrogynus ATCC 38327]
MDDPFTPAAAAAAAPVSPAQTPRSSLQAATIRPTSTSFHSTPALIALQKKDPAMASTNGTGPRRASNGGGGAPLAGVAWNGVPIGAKPSAPGTETTTTQQQSAGRRGSAPQARETLFGSTQEEQLLFQHLEHLKQLQLGIALSHAAQNGVGDSASPTSQAPGSTAAPPPGRTGPDTTDAAGAPTGMANPDTYKKNLDRFAIKREQTLALTAKLDELRRAMHDVTATARVIHAKVSAPAVPGGQDATVGGGAKQPVAAAEGLVPGPATGASTPAVFSRGGTNLMVNTGPGPL